MAAAPVALQRVGQGVKAGVHGGAGRDADGHERVDDGAAGHEDRVVDGLFLRSVGDHGDLGHLAAGAGGGGHGDDRKALVREGALAAVVFLGLAVAQGDGRGELGGVQRAAAADTDDGVGLRLAAELHGLNDAGELGVLLDAAEDADDGGVLLAQLFRPGGEVATAGDHGPLYPLLGENLGKSVKAALAEIDLDRLGIDKIICHRSHPRWRRPGRRTSSCSPCASPPDPGTIRWPGRS